MGDINPNYTFSCLTDINGSSLSYFGWSMDPQTESEFDTSGNGYAISVLATIFFLLAVPLNLFIIAAILKKNLCILPCIVFVLNLAVVNLLVALLLMPFMIFTGFRGEYAFGDTDRIRCRVCRTGILLVLLPMISMHTLALIAVDRFIYIKKPLRKVSPKTATAALIAVWVWCIVLAVPPLFGFGETRFSHATATCIPHLVGDNNVAPNYYYAILVVIEAIIPVSTILILYVWVFCIIRNSLSRRITRSLELASTQNTNEQVVIAKKYSKAQIYLVWLFVALITGSITNWIPILVLSTIYSVIGPDKIPTLGFTIPFLLYLTQTVVHPLLSMCLIKEIWQTISRYLTVLAESIFCARDNSNQQEIKTREKDENKV